MPRGTAGRKRTAAIQQENTRDELPPAAELTARDYQLEVLKEAKRSNVIAYLETGSGKTFIAVLLVKELAAKYLGKKRFLAVFLVPTVPLVPQQARVFRIHTTLRVGEFYGSKVDSWTPDKWAQELAQYDMLVMTPKVLRDRLESGAPANIKLQDVALLVLDEAHHSHGDSEYALIMQQHYARLKYRPDAPHLFGLTASLKNVGNKEEIPAMIQDIERSLHARVVTMTSRVELERVAPTPQTECFTYMRPRGDAAVQQLANHLNNAVRLLTQADTLLKTQWKMHTLHRAEVTHGSSVYDKSKSPARRMANCVRQVCKVLEDLGPFCAAAALVQLLTPRRMDALSFASQSSRKSAKTQPGSASLEKATAEVERERAELRQMFRDTCGPCDFTDDNLPAATCREAFCRALAAFEDVLIPPEYRNHEQLSDFRQAVQRGPELEYGEITSPAKKALEQLLKQVPPAALNLQVMGPSNAAQMAEIKAWHKQMGCLLVTSKVTCLMAILKQHKGSHISAPQERKPDKSGGTLGWRSTRELMMRKTRPRHAVVEDQQDETQPVTHSCIVFVKEKVTAYALRYLMDKVEDLKQFVRSRQMVGGSDADVAMTYQEQQGVLQALKEGHINVLVATSVAEEGLDVHPCKLVVRFDPPLTMTSFIQSRGRGRAADAKYVVMVEKGNQQQEDDLKKMQQLEEDVREEVLARMRERQASQQIAPSEDWIEKVVLDTGEVVVETDSEDEFEPVPLQADDSNVLISSTTGATITLASSVERLYGFCAALNCFDEFTKAKPTFITHRIASPAHSPRFQMEVILPPGAPVARAQGEVKSSKSAAKQSACLAALKELHSQGALDVHLRNCVTPHGAAVVPDKFDEVYLETTDQRLKTSLIVKDKDGSRKFNAPGSRTLIFQPPVPLCLSSSDTHVPPVSSTSSTISTALNEHKAGLSSMAEECCCLWLYALSLTYMDGTPATGELEGRQVYGILLRESLPDLGPPTKVYFTRVQQSEHVELQRSAEGLLHIVSCGQRFLTHAQLRRLQQGHCALVSFMRPNAWEPDTTPSDSSMQEEPIPAAEWAAPAHGAWYIIVPLCHARNTEAPEDLSAVRGRSEETLSGTVKRGWTNAGVECHQSSGLQQDNLNGGAHADNEQAYGAKRARAAGVHAATQEFGSSCVDDEDVEMKEEDDSRSTQVPWEHRTPGGAAHGGTSYCAAAMHFAGLDIDQQMLEKLQEGVRTGYEHVKTLLDLELFASKQAWEQAAAGHQGGEWAQGCRRLNQVTQDCILVTLYNGLLYRAEPSGAGPGLTLASAFPQEHSKRWSKKARQQETAVYEDYASYYAQKYEATDLVPFQPLLPVRRLGPAWAGSLLVPAQHKYNVDCALKLAKANGRRQSVIHVVPELCAVLPLSMSAMRALHSLPALMYRLESLLHAHQVRETVMPPSIPRSSWPALSHFLEAVTSKACREEFSLEQLEFMGDSCLKYAAVHYMFNRYRQYDEAVLTSQTHQMVCNGRLTLLAYKHGLQKHLRILPYHFDSWKAPGQAVRRERAQNAQAGIVSAYKAAQTDGVDTEKDNRGNVQQDEGANTPAAAMATEEKNPQKSQAVRELGQTLQVKGKQIADMMEAVIGVAFFHMNLKSGILVLEHLGVLPPASLSIIIHESQNLAFFSKIQAKPVDARWMLEGLPGAVMILAGGRRAQKTLSEVQDGVGVFDSVYAAQQDELMSLCEVMKDLRGSNLNRRLQLESWARELRRKTAEAKNAKKPVETKGLAGASSAIVLAPGTQEAAHAAATHHDAVAEAMQVEGQQLHGVGISTATPDPQSGTHSSSTGNPSQLVMTTTQNRAVAGTDTCTQDAEPPTDGNLHLLKHSAQGECKGVKAVSDMAHAGSVPTMQPTPVDSHHTMTVAPVQRKASEQSRTSSLVTAYHSGGQLMLDTESPPASPASSSTDLTMLSALSADPVEAEAAAESSAAMEIEDQASFTVDGSENRAMVRNSSAVSSGGVAQQPTEVVRNQSSDDVMEGAGVSRRQVVSDRGRGLHEHQIATAPTASEITSEDDSEMFWPVNKLKKLKENVLHSSLPPAASSNAYSSWDQQYVVIQGHRFPRVLPSLREARIIAAREGRPPPGLSPLYSIRSRVVQLQFNGAAQGDSTTSGMRPSQTAVHEDDGDYVPAPWEVSRPPRALSPQEQPSSTALPVPTLSDMQAAVPMPQQRSTQNDGSSLPQSMTSSTAATDPGATTVDAEHAANTRRAHPTSLTILGTRAAGQPTVQDLIHQAPLVMVPATAAHDGSTTEGPFAGVGQTTTSGSDADPPAALNIAQGAAGGDDVVMIGADAVQMSTASTMHVTETQGQQAGTEGNAGDGASRQLFVDRCAEPQDSTEASAEPGEGITCMTDLQRLELKLGYRFSTPDLAREACRHPSSAQRPSYQRLEFLGDAVVDLMLGQYIFCAHRSAVPHMMSLMKDSAINNERMARVSAIKGFHEHLQYGSHQLWGLIGRYMMELDHQLEGLVNTMGFKESEARWYMRRAQLNAHVLGQRLKPLSDLLEALVGAVFLDSGCDMERTWQLVYDLMSPMATPQDVYDSRHPVRQVTEALAMMGLQGSWEVQDVTALDAPSLKLYRGRLVVEGQEIYCCPPNRSLKTVKKEVARGVLEQHGLDVLLVWLEKMEEVKNTMVKDSAT